MRTSSINNAMFPQINDENQRPAAKMNNINVNKNIVNNISKPQSLLANTNLALTRSQILDQKPPLLIAANKPKATAAARSALADISNRTAATSTTQSQFKVFDDSKVATTAAAAITSRLLANRKPLVSTTALPPVVQPPIASFKALNLNNNGHTELLSVPMNSDMNLTLSPDCSEAIDMSCSNSPAAPSAVGTLPPSLPIEGNMNRALDAHLYVSDYQEEIFSYLFQSESRYLANSNYMQQQGDINAKMREILIDWLHEVHARFRLQSETLYLTINIVDRFLSLKQISRKKLQLVGCVAMLIAAKYEEIYVPEVDDFVHISDKAYSREQILDMEYCILGALQFNFTTTSAWRFAERFILALELGEEVKNCTNFLLQITLQNYKFLQYNPSQLAAAAVYLAFSSVSPTDTYPWDHKILKYSYAEMAPVVGDLFALWQEQQQSKYQAVNRKFLKQKYEEIAKINIINKPYPC
jgi:hypothetical protein